MYAIAGHERNYARPAAHARAPTRLLAGFTDILTAAHRLLAPGGILAINARYRRAANASGHFPNEQAALKRIHPATLALDPGGKGKVRWANRWKEVLNAFDLKFDGRVSAGRR